MTESNTLYSKEGFVFKKNEKNNYSLSFEMENNNINLSKIIDFNLVKLIYDLNSDIYEKVNLQIINENEATIVLLMKHLFEEIGLPQRFSNIYMTKIVEENNIKFVSQTIKSERPQNMPPDAESMNIKTMTFNCNLLTQHKIKVTCNILFEDIMNIPEVIEKIVGLILYKIFNRVKQFIENVRM
jgi:hypothetical protein